MTIGGSLPGFYSRYAMLAWYLPSSSVCMSVTSQCFSKMAKPRIMQTMPYDRPGTLVF